MLVVLRPFSSKSTACALKQARLHDTSQVQIVELHGDSIPFRATERVSEHQSAFTDSRRDTWSQKHLERCQLSRPTHRGRNRASQKISNQLRSVSVCTQSAEHYCSHIFLYYSLSLFLEEKVTAFKKCMAALRVRIGMIPLIHSRYQSTHTADISGAWKPQSIIIQASCM